VLDSPDVDGPHPIRSPVNEQAGINERGTASAFLAGRSQPDDGFSRPALPRSSRAP
jgi:hypothetical protein